MRVYYMHGHFWALDKSCPEDIRAWMSLNLLKLTEKKAGVMVFGLGGFYESPLVDLSPLTH